MPVRYLISTIFFIGFLIAFTDGQRRTFHDRLARTVVVGRAREVWTADSQTRLIGLRPRHARRIRSLVVSLNDLPPPSGVVMSPAPTDEEAAAIMAATEALWPKPVVLARSTTLPESPRVALLRALVEHPVPARRNRPYR